MGHRLPVAIHCRITQFIDEVKVDSLTLLATLLPQLVVDIIMLVIQIQLGHYVQYLLLLRVLGLLMVPAVQLKHS